MKLLIERYSFSKKQTIGRGYLLDDNDTIIFDFSTLELPYLKNKRNISCIPKGKYKVKKRYSDKFKNHFHILDVPNRDFILIHRGNYYTQLRGCILVGSDLKWLNFDDEVDVINSVKTLDKLLNYVDSEIELEIIEI